MHVAQRLRELSDRLIDPVELTMAEVRQIGLDLLRIADWLEQAGIKEIPVG